MNNRLFEKLDDWLAWMEGLHPSEIDLGLTRIAEVARRLEIDTSQAKVVTVAGTNGKGSCVATLEQLLLSGEQSVGAFTSPHILKYNERIRVNGVPVSDALICDAFNAINQARGDISLTYFEFGTLAALYVFQQSQVVHWLLEVGLGGRLDAVNIIDPDIAVITSIAIDHSEWLGDTRELIAKEKAGILRKGIPAVCTDRDPPMSLLKSFEDNDVQLHLIDKDFRAEEYNDGCRFDFSPTGETYSVDVKSKLPIESVAAGLKVYQLLGFSLSQQQFNEHVKQTSLKGRFDCQCYQGRSVYLDVAHNPAATAKLAERLRQNNIESCVAVLAMMCDKQHRETLQPLLPYVKRWYVSAIEGMPRSETAQNLKATLIELGVSSDIIEDFSSAGDALVSALTVGKEVSRQMADVEQMPLLVFGSFFTVSEGYQYLSGNQSQPVKRKLKCGSEHE